MSMEKEAIENYPPSRQTSLHSIAISLKRIADSLEKHDPEALRLALYNGICEGIFAARPK